MCSTTPADALEMHSLGRIVPGASADLVVVDAELQVRMTFVDGKLVYEEEACQPCEVTKNTKKK